MSRVSKPGSKGSTPPPVSKPPVSVPTSPVGVGLWLLKQLPLLSSRGSLWFHSVCFQRGHRPHFVSHSLKHGEFDFSGENFHSYNFISLDSCRDLGTFRYRLLGRSVFDGKGESGQQVSFGLEQGVYDFLTQSRFQVGCSFGASVSTLTFIESLMHVRPCAKFLHRSHILPFTCFLHGRS